MNVVKELERINAEELRLGITDEKSWHAEYRGSAWIFIGGLAYSLTEGDVICVFSQFGEVEDLHLVRDDDTGKSKGFAFLKYSDWRSTVLAVDNMNGVDLLGRTIRVDHKLGYEPPKKKGDDNDKPNGEPVVPKAMQPGHAYESKELANAFDIERGVNLFSAPPVAAAAAASAASAALDNGMEDLAAERSHHRSSRGDHAHKHRHRRRGRDDTNEDEQRHSRRHREGSSDVGNERRSRSDSSRDAEPETRRAIAPPAPLPVSGGGGSGVMSWRGRCDPSLAIASSSSGGTRDDALRGGRSSGFRDDGKNEHVSGLARRR